MPIQPYDYPASQADDFERKGHPGRFLKSIVCSTGTTYFTGSNFGAGGIIVPTSTTGTASLSGGGDVPLASIAGTATAGNSIVELSLRSVKVDSGTVYVLIKNPSIW
jgi:hypothetical protein